MLVTEPGMVTEVNLLHPANAQSPMLVTESGMVTEVKPVIMNAPLPMLVTPAGMLIEAVTSESSAAWKYTVSSDPIKYNLHNQCDTSLLYTSTIQDSMPFLHSLGEQSVCPLNFCLASLRLQPTN